MTGYGFNNYQNAGVPTGLAPKPVVPVYKAGQVDRDWSWPMDYGGNATRRTYHNFLGPFLGPLIGGVTQTFDDLITTEEERREQELAQQQLTANQQYRQQQLEIERQRLLAQQRQSEQEQKTLLYVGLGVGAVVLVTIGFLVFRKRKK